MDKPIIIGTRGSKLALWQANDLKDQLEGIGHPSELKIIKTQGDRVQDLSFDKLEGKGFFTKEIEDELIQNKIDIAVHSLKDLPTSGIEELVIAGLSQRVDCSDLLIINKSSFTEGEILNLPKGAKVGTSSIRRKRQLLHLAPQVKVIDLRGNVPTRIDKLRSGKYDAIILASAGVNRLNISLDEFKTIRLNPKEFIPAPGQGVIAYQTRKNDVLNRKVIAKIHQKEIARRTNVERRILQLMDGGCQLPLGAYCDIDANGNYHVWSAFSPDENVDLKIVKLSQSTHNQLAENVVQLLKN